MRNLLSKFVVLTFFAITSNAAIQAQDVIGYITKSATNAGWMMINQEQKMLRQKKE